MNTFHVSGCRLLLSTLVIFGVLLQSESFSFTRKPANRTVVVEGVNSTQVELVWNFTATSGFIVSILRERTDGSQRTQIAARSNSDAAFDILKSGYEANLPATLVIKDVTRNDEYVYGLVVSTSSGVRRLTDEVTVEVFFPAKLTNVSHDHTVHEGSDIQLFCEATGDPEPDITWTRVLENGSYSKVLEQGPTFDLRNINRTSSGIQVYTCRAFNGFGTPTSDRIKVNVTYAADIVEVTASKTEVAVQQSVSLQCKAKGNPSPSYRWTPCEQPQRVCYNSVLNISEVLNDGLYVCTVRNTLGSNVGNVSVFIAGNVINVTLVITNEKCNGGKYNQSLLWTKLNETMNSLFANRSGYYGAQLKSVRCGSVIVDLELKFNSTIREREVINILRNAAKSDMFGTLQVNASSITGTRPVPGKTTTATPSASTTSSSGTNSEMTWIIVGVVLGIIALGVAVAVIAWCMYKKRKCNRKDTKEVHSNESQVQAKGNAQGEYSEVNPGYVIAESNRNSTGVNPVTYDTVGNSTKKGKGAVVDETPTVSYAVVDKSKKKKREKKPKPGELQYAELAEFSRPQEMPKSSTSRGSYPTETQYADVNAM